MASTWTTPVHVRDRLRKLWERGDILRASLTDEPYRIPLKGPTSEEMPRQFDAIRRWIEALQAEFEQGDAGRRLEWREINHRQLGRNRVPRAVLFDNSPAVARYLKVYRALERFTTVVETLRTRRPELVAWAAAHPRKAVEVASALPGILHVVDWRLDHSDPDIYLRELSLPEVDTKFIERHRGVISRLLEIALPPEQIDAAWTGAAGFARRYGFRSPPELIRFRLLDPEYTVGGFRDLTVPIEDFRTFAATGIEHVFITENDLNGLAFPAARHSMVIFGRGFAVAALAGVDWLHRRHVSYWGDIDTHGFAILDLLRSHISHVASIFMDRDTLMRHRDHWGTEPKPTNATLEHLTEEEAGLYSDLCTGSIRANLRLEQEFVDIRLVREVVARIAGKR